MSQHAESSRACRNLRRRIALFVGTALLVACAPSAKRIAEGGMSGTGAPLVAIGAIGETGRLVVNGLEWDASAATVTVNGTRDSLATLSRGMIVRVEGSRDGGIAKAVSVQYESDVLGPLADSEQLGQGARLIIAGQPVMVGPQTLIEGASGVPGLSKGQFLEVSGYRDSAGLLRATWIGPRGNAGGMVLIKGIIRDVTSTSFSVGDLKVDYRDIPVRELAAVPIKTGAVVALRGRLSSAERLSAEKVEARAGAVALPDNISVSMEGLIRNVSAAGFTMHNRPILVSERTLIVPGRALDLRNDQRAYVEGVYRQGVLNAARVVLSRAEPQR
jgi:hypothetical protein